MKKVKKRKRDNNTDDSKSSPTEDMDIESFLGGGFELLAKTGNAPGIDAAEKSGNTKKSNKVKGIAAKSGTEQKQKGEEKKKKARTQDAASAPAPADEQPEVEDKDENQSETKAVADAARKELKSHKEQLEALKTTDPEFYEYLQQSDKTLLQFEDDGGDSDLDSLMSEEEGDEDAKDDSNLQSKRPAQGSKQPGTLAETPAGYVTTAAVKYWCSAAKEKPSLLGMQRVLKVYRAACHYGDAVAAAEDNEDEAAVRIASDSAFQHILVFTLTEADSIFRQLLSIQTPPSNPLPSSCLSSNKWKKVGSLVKSYLGNTLHLLSHLAEEVSLTFILRRLRASMAFLCPFEKLLGKLLKLVAGLFGTSRLRPVRVQSLLWLRECGIVGGPQIMPRVLRSSYRAFALQARLVSASTLPDLAFMVSGLVELFGIDHDASYEVMFQSIAQLAELMRGAITAKTVDAYRQVYCWKTINCLELWGRVLAAHHSIPGFKPLLFPVCNLLLGAARLVPSPRWFPVRLRLTRILTAVAAATGVFVPVAPLLLEVLAWPGFSKRVTGSVGKCPALTLQLRLSKSNLSMPAVQQEIVQQAFEVLAGCMALYVRNPAFPEYSHLPTLALRKFAKTTPVDKFRTQANILLDAVNKQVRLVGVHRDGVDFSPKDRDQVAAFMKDTPDSSMPLIVYATGLAEKGALARSAAEKQHGEMFEKGGHKADSDDEIDIEPDAEDDVDVGKLGGQLLSKIPTDLSDEDAGDFGVDDAVDGKAEDTVGRFVLSDDEEDDLEPGVDEEGDAEESEEDADLDDLSDEGPDVAPELNQPQKKMKPTKKGNSNSSKPRQEPRSNSKQKHGLGVKPSSKVRKSGSAKGKKKNFRKKR